MPKHNTSGYKGVSLCKRTGKWRVELSIDGKSVSLKSFFTKEEAARAYDMGAIYYFGEYAVLNFPRENYPDKVDCKPNVRKKPSEVQLADIRNRVKSGELQNSLAKEYGMSIAAVSRIVNNKTWN